MADLVTLSENKLGPSLKGNIGPKSSAARNTARQLAVLGALAQYGMMPIQQLADALDIGNQNAKKTAKILRERGDVSWCRWYDIHNDNALNGPKNLIHILTLTDRGHRRLVKFGDFPPDKPVLTRRWKGVSKSLPKMNHDREVIKVLMAFNEHVALSNHFIMSKMLVEPVRQKRKVNDQEKSVSTTSDKLANGKAIIADAIMCIENPATENKFTVFIEYENYQAKWLVEKRARRKMINYKSLFLTKDRYFDEGQPLLFYVVPKQARIREIFKLEEVSPLLGVLRVGFIDDVLKDPLGKSWMRGAHEAGRFKLHAWSPVHG